MLNPNTGMVELKNFFISYRGKIHMDVEPQDEEFKPAITFELEKGGADHKHLLELNTVLPTLLRENYKSWGVSSKITHFHFQVCFTVNHTPVSHLVRPQEFGKPKPESKEAKDEPVFKDEENDYKKHAKQVNSLLRTGPYANTHFVRTLYKGSLYQPSKEWTGQHYNTSLKVHIPTKGRVVDDDKYYIKDENGKQEDATGVFTRSLH